MKKILTLVLLFASLAFAQEKKVEVADQQTTAHDTINVSQIVQKQIQDALEKQNASKASVVPETLPEKINLPEKVKVEPQPVQSNIILNYVINLPIHIQIFTALSVCIIFFVIFRRIITSIKRKSLNTLKQKITMLREEKVRAKVNPKLQLARKQLRGKEMVFMKSDQQISKAARELNISKGELLLAARLKLYEVGKM